MSNPQFLATTALEDFWDKSGPIVFLSEACTRYSRKDIWQKLSQEILQNPVLDRSRYYKEYAYLQSFYERMLTQIKEVFNEIHGQKYNIRYWRIVLGFWLFSYIHLVYERYSSVKNALTKYPGLTTILMDPRDFNILQDTKEFMSNSGEDAYNLQIYSRVFTFLGKSFPSKHYIRSVPDTSSAGTKNMLKTIGAEIGSHFAKFAQVIARQPYIPRHIDKLSFLLACRGKLWIDFRPDEQLSALPPDISMRTCLKGLKIDDNEFERFFLATYSDEIPQVFVEGYADFNKKVSRIYPFKPKAIWSATSWCWEEAFKFWAAARSQEGTVLAGMQHGGNYGMDLIHPAEEHETAITDRFYSWGWDKISTPVVKPMPVTKYIGAKRLDADNDKKGVLFATVAIPRYVTRFHTFRSVDYQSYIHNQEHFISVLSPKLKALTRIRLFINDYGWDCRERWNDFDPQVILEDWKEKFSDSMKNSRIHVSDHLSSTFIDALAVGKPTILFWDPEIFKVRPETEPYLDDLRRVGILYDTPQSAAITVDQVYDDVETWWNDPPRQNILQKFCHRFARTSPIALKEWAREIAVLAKGGALVPG